MYTLCVIRDVHNPISLQFLIDIDYKDKVHPKCQSVAVGETVRFVCFSTVPVLWSFNDGELPSNAIIQELKQRSVVNTLILYDVSPYNTGAYHCSGKDENLISFEEFGYLQVDGENDNKIAISKILHDMIRFHCAGS